MTDLSGESIAIVGAGFGGLSAAAHLGDAGARVTVYEKGEHVGGVAGRIVEDGFQFDTGPSWYLMPELFERFFEQFGHEPAEFYELERLDPNYRVFWTDGDEAIRAKLAEHGKGGVPMYLMYTPGKPDEPRMLSESLQVSEVVGAMEDAAANAQN